jgi:predicted PurR-regulated permease PerM
VARAPYLEDEEAPDLRRPAARVEVTVSVHTLLVLLAFGVLVALALLSLATLISILVAAVLALGLDPPVSALVRRGWGRTRAALCMFAAIFVAAVVLVLLVVGPVWQQIQEFVHQLPQYWEELTGKPGFKELTSTASADDTIRKALNDLASGLPDAANVIFGALGSAFGAVLSLVTLTFLSLFLLMERPTITDWLFGFTRPEVEARWHPVVEDSIQAVSTSLIGNVAISVLAGLVGGISAWLFGLPFPIVLGLIAGVLDLIPQVGATVASIILVAVALTVSTPAAVAMLVIQLVYQQLENYVVYPIVYRRAVALSGFTTIVAVLIGAALLGVAGAILAVPFAAVIKTVLREAGRPRRERMAALRSGDDAQLAAGVVQAPPAALDGDDDVLDPHPEPAG